jgi:hypothetical protein
MYVNSKLEYEKVQKLRKLIQVQIMRSLKPSIYINMALQADLAHSRMNEICIHLGEQVVLLTECCHFAT